MALVGREKSMSFLWFVVASLVAAATLWVVYDETIGRRTWKQYATEWEALETKKIETAIQAEEKKINPQELKKIQLEKEKAVLILESAEFQRLVKDSEEKKKVADDAAQDQQFAKADQDEIFYLWKHAQEHGEDYSAYKKQYDELQKKINGLTAIQEKREGEYLQSVEAIAEKKQVLKDLEIKEAKMFEKVEGLKKQLEAVKDRGAPIEQFVLPDLGINGATQWGSVDRCTSCHINTLKTGYEKEKEPFKTHPHLKELFVSHPVEKYGCVTCHGGQGRATQILGKPLEEGDYAHGYEHHWLNPLVRGDFTQSTCNKCHVNQLRVGLAPIYNQGKKLFVDYGCVGCHKINGLEWGPKAGPSLTRIKEKVYPEWMYSWVKKPTDYLPHTRMPQAPWVNEQDMLQTMAYLLDKSEPFNWKYGKFPGGNIEAGKELFNTIGCLACHNIGGNGGTAGPALDRIAEKTSADWIYNWIQEPKNWSHTARMPSLRLSKDEASNLAAYLSGLGKKPEQDAKLRTALSDPKNIEAGFKAINTYGCYGCHNIKGFDQMSNPSVELTNFGRKDVAELAFGDAKIPHTWEAWTDGKLKNPQMFVDERSSSFMPKPNITDEQRHALLVFLRGQRPEELPKQYVAFDADIENGRRVLNFYNCTSCHMIEGEGQEVAKWVTEPNFLPPNLASAGARLQTNWMFGFLHNPGDYPKVRTWLNLRMPTFGFTDEELNAVVKYFKKQSGVENVLLEEHKKFSITPEYQFAAQKLMSADNFNCGSCHIIGNKFPEGGPTVYAPNLDYVHVRIRPEWIRPWLKNPSDLVPGTRMPGYYPEPGTGPKDVLNGDDDKQLSALIDYLMTLGVQGSLTNAPETQPTIKSETPKSTSEEKHKEDEGKKPGGKKEVPKKSAAKNKEAGAQNL